MAIIFDFEAGKDFHFASAFAKRFDRVAVNDRVSLPEMLGEGFIQEIYLDSGLSLCLHHYMLRQEFILRRGASGATNVLTMKFSLGKAGEVEFGTGNFFTELSIPPGGKIDFLVIVATRQTLLQLLKPGQEEAAMESMIRDNPSFVLHEEMTREMERALRQLLLIDETTKLPGLLYQTKAQELIYFLFARLLSRNTGASVTVNREDAEKMYRIRAGILADLSSPPQLPALARKIGMSATRMKQLFRQIFGDSIYNYYQTVRMNEAANLLSHKTVSEAGYSVGFTNLSHFTRLFEKHHQMKPKRYKDSLEGSSTRKLRH
jgi:AraC-like DNA-binding protein